MFAGDDMNLTEALLGRIDRVLMETHRLELLRSTPALRDPKSVVPYGYKVYSQNDEDGIIEEIFRRIGTTNRYFVEFGAETGTENNTVNLLVQGWRGAWIEGSAEKCREISRLFSKSYLQEKQLRALEAFVTAENIEEHFRKLDVPAKFDLLSIDIDYNDYWVWRAITQYQPRVVVIEFNAAFGPSAEFVVPYNPRAVWDLSRYFGASLKSLELLGRNKGYRLVACSLLGNNAFFVREEECADRFVDVTTSEAHFLPARYYLQMPTGHPLSPLEFTQRREPAEPGLNKP